MKTKDELVSLLTAQGFSQEKAERTATFLTVIITCFPADDDETTETTVDNNPQ